MKEIDFLPKWYRRNRRRSISYKWQYAIMAAVFIFMVGWSFIAGRVVNSTQADIQTNADADNISDEYKNFKQQLIDLSGKDEFIEKCSSKIVLSQIIAELGFLIDESIILNKVQITAEDFKNGTKKNAKRRAVSRGSSAAGKDFPGKNVIYKVAITGVAAEPGNVAELICKLESSDYFCNVITGFTKNAKVKDFLVSEFEIGCYIANYKELEKTK